MVGKLDIFTGPMFSGKTTALLRELILEAEIGRKVLYVNSSLDTRSKGNFSTHNPLCNSANAESSEKITFVSSSSVSDLSEFDVLDFDVIGIDEAQFFDDLKEGCVYLVEKKDKRVIVAGLSANFKRQKFGQILDLEPYSDSFIKLKSFCKKCAPGKRKDALFSHLMKVPTPVIPIDPGHPESDPEESSDVVIGGNDKYVALCRKCYCELNS